MWEEELLTPRIGLSICFGISGFIFFLLLLDSHYRCINGKVIEKIQNFGKV